MPAPFDGWFQRATNPDPTQRFRSARVLVNELAQALGIDIDMRASSLPVVSVNLKTNAEQSSKVAAGTVSGTELSTLAQSKTRKSRRKTAAIAAGMLAVLATAGGVLSLHGRQLPTAAVPSSLAAITAAVPVPVVAAPTVASAAESVTVVAEPSALPSKSNPSSVASGLTALTARLPKPVVTASGEAPRRVAKAAPPRHARSIDEPVRRRVPLPESAASGSAPQPTYTRD